MLTAHIDDSGSDGQAAHFLLASYVASAECWVRFSDAWSIALVDGPRPLRYFKSAEAESLRGEFSGWTVEERNYKLQELAEIINAHVEFGMVSAVSRKAYDEIVRPYAAEHAFMKHVPLFNSVFSPYMFLVSDLVFGLLAEANFRKARIDFILDSQPEKQALATRAYQIHIPEFFLIPGLERIKRYIGSFTYASEQEVVALQAADMLAWHDNRHRERSHEEGERSIYRQLNEVRITRCGPTPGMMKDLVEANRQGINPYTGERDLDIRAIQSPRRA